MQKPIDQILLESSPGKFGGPGAKTDLFCAPTVSTKIVIILDQRLIDFCASVMQKNYVAIRNRRLINFYTPKVSRNIK